ncbi:tRNA (adenine(22)-N(1))-methyltransferase [Paenibacillus arenilitoris]|uniref:tRNA (Adenine-N(1))-methyltransferase n=1 Tax=Paenibacillus arenilitoris TaxID=2772299 RepID=A0A927CPD0_9BACL|nr:class I SAM-dependent methyltransferase [Paenibacillus arenilitoris]MBD2869501.1 tRNA (adenine-N(1))-methyltransferase [Paenibacillus arenilitoris]
MKLSRRLQAVADYVTSGHRMADIGSDHAMLPVYLLQAGKCPSAVAGELNKGPYEAARKQVADAGLNERLAVRQGNGLAVVRAGETDAVTIAGMGGSLMRDILETGRKEGKLEGVKELVLQPNVGEELVREWLFEQGWYLKAESIVEEDGKIYEIMHAVKSEDAAARNAELYDGRFLPLELSREAGRALLMRMGPHLLRSPQPALFTKWRGELHKLERIWWQMGDSELPEAARKRERYREEMNRLEEVLQCLPTVKPSYS